MDDAGATNIFSFTPQSNEDEDAPFSVPQPLASTGQAYAPKWLMPKCGARFGPGGMLVAFDGKNLRMHSHNHKSEKEISDLVQNFDQSLTAALGRNDLTGLLSRKI